MSDLRALRDLLPDLPPEDQAAVTARLAWLSHARPAQIFDVSPQAPSVTLALSGRGWGKPVALSTLIPTSSGWTTMGDIQVGETIFDETGAMCRVREVHPVLLGQSCYRVGFSDGSHIVATGDHLWFTETKRVRKARGRALPDAERKRARSPGRPVLTGSVVTTEHIRATLYADRGREVNHSIPCARPLELLERDLPVSPYTLGVWLGDGSSASAEVTTLDEELLEHLRQDGTTCVPYRQASGKCPRYGMGKGWLSAALRVLGLLGNKHIPQVYLRSSIAQRTALLHGLMDTDGSCSPGGNAEFLVTCLPLAEGFIELVRSLGFKPTWAEERATIDGRDVGPRYRVSWTPHTPVFRLSRKLCRQHHGRAQAARATTRYITSVDPVPSVPVRCIAVDSSSRLFLAGPAMVPTHNTRSSAEAAWWRCYSSPGEWGGMVSPTTSELRKTLFEGESGLRACCPPEILRGGSWQAAYNVSLPQLHFANGSALSGFSAENPERFRGPNLSFMVYDELASYPDAQAVWDVSRFALRKGHPISIITTTPKPIQLLFDLSRAPKTHVVRGSTYDNLDNLAPGFRDTVLAYEGTVFGRQEIHAELLRDNSGAIFDKAWLRMWPAKLPLPTLRLLLSSYDTAYTTRSGGSSTAWVTLGVVYNEATQRNCAVVLDCGSGNIGYPALRKQVLDNWNAPREGRLPDLALIEAKGAGLSLLSDFQSEGVTMASYLPTTDKVLRAHTISHLVSNGLLLFREDRDNPGRLPPWAKAMVNQLLLFPSADQDDYVDALTQSLHYLRDSGWLSLHRSMEPAQEEAVAEHLQERRATRGNPYTA